jgi:Putative  PD-(D/E)XK family member, (DUF4420)
MVNGLSSSHWSQLRAVRPQSEDALAIIPIFVDGNETALSSAMDQSGLLHLLIPVTQGPAVTPPADLNGLKVRHRRLETGAVLELSAPASHEQVFTPFCNEIVDAIVCQSREPWKAVAAIVRAWQSAWKPARQVMDKSTQIGLFGELLVLRSLMLPTLGPAAVDQWSGPESERHDFVGDQLHIEVKTTRKSRPEHEISRLDQLSVPAGRQMLFVSVQLEESVGGNETLASQVDSIVDLLRTDAAALDLFMTKIANLGWSEEVRNSGELLRFFVRSADVYAVDDDFPRFPDDFSPPAGVISVKYTIDLANLPSLGMDEVGVIIKAANNGRF